MNKRSDIYCGLTKKKTLPSDYGIRAEANDASLHSFTAWCYRRRVIVKFMVMSVSTHNTLNALSKSQWLKERVYA